MKKIIGIAMCIVMLAGTAQVSAQKKNTDKEKQKTEQKAEKKAPGQKKEKQAPGQIKDKQEPGQAAGQADGRQQPSQADRAKQGADRMKEQLSLTDDQYAKVLDLNKEQAEKRANAPRPSREEIEKMTDEQKAAMRDEMRKQRDEYNTKLKGILSGEQYAKYEENMKNSQRGGQQGQRPQGTPQGGKPSGGNN